MLISSSNKSLFGSHVPRETVTTILLEDIQYHEAALCGKQYITYIHEEKLPDVVHYYKDRYINTIMFSASLSLPILNKDTTYSTAPRLPPLTDLFGLMGRGRGRPTIDYHQYG